MEFIRIRDVEKTYPTGVTALYGLNLEIKKGDFVFIIGASGSGKSTLMKMLYREEKASNGEIIIGGVKVGKLKNRKVYKLRRKLGVVFQDFKLLPKLTAYENVAFVLEMFGYDEEGFEKYLMTAGFPPVDLLIRTSGEERISNYLLWQIAYAELEFVPEAWPAFTPEVFRRCLEEYQQRDRRFGGVKNV